MSTIVNTFNATDPKILVHYPTKRNKKIEKINEVFRDNQLFKRRISKPLRTNFQKQHLILRYRFYGRCWGANTFPARKRTPELNFLFFAD